MTVAQWARVFRAGAFKVNRSLPFGTAVSDALHGMADEAEKIAEEAQ